MAAATAKYDFRFYICLCHCLQKVKVYRQTKFRRYISIGGWDITTSGFEIQTSVILELYFRFRSRPFRRNRRVILHPAAEFGVNRNIRCRNMTSYRFSRWRLPAMLYLFWSNGGPPTKCLSWSELDPEIACSSKLLQVIDFGVFAWNCILTLLFGGVFEACFPHITSSIVLTPKRTIRWRKHVVSAIQCKNRCNGSTWAGDEEKKDRI